MFGFHRRTARQQRATGALLVVVPAATAGYLVLDRLLTRAIGGFWGVLLALVMAGVPVAALFRVAECNRNPRQAVLDGIAIATAGAALYAWGFGSPW